MFGVKQNKDKHRFYLLPGMGKSNKRRHLQLLRWSIAVGMIVSALFAYLLYRLNSLH